MSLEGQMPPPHRTGGTWSPSSAQPWSSSPCPQPQCRGTPVPSAGLPCAEGGLLRGTRVAMGADVKMS